ncbi:MAG: M56 family metallopeptidase [Gemmatimonadaceae bacterium]
MPIVVEVIAVVLAHAIGAWLITYLLHSTVLIAAAHLSERIRSEPALHAVAWRTALLAPLFTASLHTALPFGSPLRMGTEPAGAVLGPRPVLSLIIVACWCVLVAVRLIAIVRAELRARAAMSPRIESSDTRYLRMLATLSNAAGMRRSPRLTTSPRIFSPAALAPGEICIPDRIFDELTPGQQHALLAHEVAHLVRHDPLWCGAATAVAALCFFQPLNTHALRRLRRSTEHAADARALHHKADPLALGEALAALAPHALRSQQLRTAATGSPVLERIQRILDQPAQQHSARWIGAVQVIALVGLCLAIGPGVNFNVDDAANSIPSLTPSRAEPTPQMIEMRHLDRRLRVAERVVERRVRAGIRP